jgi:hypothetical protein
MKKSEMRDFEQQFTFKEQGGIVYALSVIE